MLRQSLPAHAFFPFNPISHTSCPLLSLKPPPKPSTTRVPGSGAVRAGTPRVRRHRLGGSSTDTQGSCVGARGCWTLLLHHFDGSAWKPSQAAACPGWEGGLPLPGRAQEESVWHPVPEQAWSQAFSILTFATLSIPVYFLRAWREAPVL